MWERTEVELKICLKRVLLPGAGLMMAKKPLAPRYTQTDTSASVAPLSLAIAHPPSPAPFLPAWDSVTIEPRGYENHRVFFSLFILSLLSPLPSLPPFLPLPVPLLSPPLPVPSLPPPVPLPPPHSLSSSPPEGRPGRSVSTIASGDYRPRLASVRSGNRGVAEQESLHCRARHGKRQGSLHGGTLVLGMGA